MVGKPSYFYFETNHLFRLADELGPAYRSASPFPHVVIDNFIPDERVIDDVIAEFPEPDSIDWIHFKGGTEEKLASRDETQLGDVTRHLLHEFNSSHFCLFLEKLTGIEGIIPDPHFWGGGLHQIERDGFLKVHADFNIYGRFGLDRRINVLLYLNKDWREEFGGHLELWSTDMKRCEKKVLPLVNRCVIFSTDSTSFHGHPEPLKCPPGWTRKSLALYYYSNTLAERQKAINYSTTFQARPGEKFAGRTKAFVKRLVPPILLDIVRKVRR